MVCVAGSCQSGNYNMHVNCVCCRPLSVCQLQHACELCVAGSCQFGSYYNLTLDQCVLCPVGFYAEMPGSYLCDACPFQETTAREGSTASVSCSVNPITTTSAAPFTTGAGELSAHALPSLSQALPQA